jgi:hypothetical protein
VITQLNPRNLDPTVRAANEKLMAAFIRADLPRRVGLDTRRSVVLPLLPSSVRVGCAIRSKAGLARTQP